MDTRTGEVFPFDEDRNLAKAEYGSEREYRRALKRMADAEARGELVPISEQVARQQRIGQRVEERRAKRKAAKAARKQNRG